MMAWMNSPIISSQTSQEAAAYISQHDPRLAPIIAQVGPCTIEPHTDYYRALVWSIIGQQLSVKAAATIKQRFVDLFDGTFPSPEQILETSFESLRSVGLSGSKAKYIQDLALHIADGKLRFDTIETMTNEEIIAMLTDIKGIGEWTAHMFLMFSMGRMDILALGDLGVRSAIRNLYGFEKLPTPQEVIDIATKNQWHPYESIACWYLWRTLDNEPVS